MEFESPDVEKEFPGLYASESGKRSNESDFSDEAHERPSKKDLLIGKRKDKKDSKKDRGYAALGGESSPEEDPDTKSPSKSKKSKSFKFPSSIKKEKREKSREKDGKEKEREADKEKKKDKEVKSKLKLKERKKSKHGAEDIIEIGDEQPVFGVPLLLAVTRSRCHDGVDIPLVIRDAIDYVQEHGVSMESVYKISGVKSKVQHLRRLYNQREPAQPADYDIATATSLIKQFLRELPEPILTNELLTRFEEAAASKDVLVREKQLSAVVRQLPECNRQLLAWIVVHLESVTMHEKQNKMNAQNMAITLSPVLQMSHRLFTALLCHSRFLFPGVSLKKYIPPLTAASPAMPDTEAGIEEELRKQESLLNQTHQEMNAGFVSKKKEEQLWEVQRIITQLKRKLRTFQRTREMSLNQKSMDEERSRQSFDDEFRIDLTLQKAHSVCEEDRLPAPSTIPLAPVVKPSADVSPMTPSEPADSVTDTIGAEFGTMTPPTSNDPSTSLIVEEVDVLDGGIVGDRLSPSLDGSLEGVDRLEPDEELQGLLQEETLLQLEQEELLNLQADLQGRVQGERAEIERLRAELAIARAKYNYRGFGCDSSDTSSTPSLSDASDTEDPEIEERFLELRRENLLLQEKKAALVRRIMEEREACLHLRVQVSLMQLTREGKQHA